MWLTVALLGMGLPSILYPVVREWTALTSGVPEELLAAASRIANEPSPWWLTAYLLMTQALLLWFTYFSRSPRVRDNDRFWVFLVMCVAALSWILTIA